MKPLDIGFVILLSLGALQGLIYAIILWRQHSTNKKANRFLSTILFFFAYRLIVEIFKLFGLGYYDIFYHLFLEYNWIYGPLIFFFVKAYVSPDFKFEIKKEWFHFLPVFIEFGWSNFIKTQNFYWDGTRESLSWLGYWGYVVWMQYPTQYLISALLVIVYTIKSEKLLLKTDHETFEIITDRTKWITRILKVLKIYACLVIVIVLLDFIFFDYAFNRSYHIPIFVGMAAITYWLGLEGFNKKDLEILRFKTVLNEKEKTQLKTIANKLEEKMISEKLFKNPDLSLKILASEIDEKSYLITKSLNLILDTKFNDFVNSYRIEELKSLLKDPSNNDYTLLGLAHEVGFNSKASFNRAVKKLTGKSPSALKTSL